MKLDSLKNAFLQLQDLRLKEIVGMLHTYCITSASLLHHYCIILLHAALFRTYLRIRIIIIINNTKGNVNW